MSDDFITHLNASRFMAQRAIDAESIPVDPPKAFALPGSLVPIAADRLEAHHDEGMDMHAIVQYENERFLDAQEGRRERHRAWVAGPYDAIVQADRELQAERMQREAAAAVAYRQRVAELLARKANDA